MMTFGSLFTGIGGMDLGLERAGMRCLWQVEVDSYCRRVLEKHWPNVPKHGDIRNVDGTELAPVDVIAGGFPCQDISNAGKREGITGARSGLWSDMLRIIRLVRPRFVIVENVAALLVRGMDVVLGDLAESGFDAEWDCVPASAFGCPSWQSNVWIVAHATSERCSQPWHDQPYTVHGGETPSWQTSDAINAVRGGTVPGVCREHRRPANRVDRLRGLGNAVVPQVAQWIGERVIAANGVTPC